MTIQLYVLLALGAALTVVALALLTIKALNAAVRLSLGIAAGIGLAVVGIIALQSVSIPTLIDVDITDLSAPSLPQVAEQPRRGLSAAASIIITLGLIVMAMLALVLGALGVWWWWSQRQKREKLELMALLYGGNRPQLPRPQRRVLYPRQPYVVPQPQPEFGSAELVEGQPWEVLQ